MPSFTRFNLVLLTLTLTFALSTHAAISAALFDDDQTPRDPVRPTIAIAMRSTSTATKYADPVRLTSLLAERIGLEPGPAYQVLAQFVSQTVAEDPSRYDATDDPQKVLEQMLREDLSGFQRCLSPLVPDDVYQRYLALLDELQIAA